VVCFVLARSFGTPLVRRFVHPARLATVKNYFTDRSALAAASVLLILRLFAFASFDVVSYACGLLGVPLPLFLVVSAVGVMPKVFAFTYLGANLGPQPVWLNVLIAVGTLGILVVIPFVLRRVRQRPLGIANH
jgi:uncharacterized membrane protein YdjX (TVP38/TMEM64 family)